MPVRLLREGINDSEAVNALTFPAEVFYRRLMSAVDDFGRFDGRPAVLRSRLYPLKIDTVREADITRWIAECEKAGLIALYAVNSKPYILFGKLGSPRAKESKFPEPPPGLDETIGRAQTRADESGCEQTHAGAPYSGSYSGSGTSSIKDTPKPPQAGAGAFDQFWIRYPRKESKPAALKAWKKLNPSPELIGRIYDAIERQQRHGCLEPRLADGRSVIPHASTWINNRRWEDEPPTATKPTDRKKRDAEIQARREQAERDAAEAVKPDVVKKMLGSIGIGGEA
jgi:hypothetical protein